MANRAEDHRLIPHSAYDVHRAIYETLMRLCSGVVGQDGWVLHGRTSANFGSYGETIEVHVEPVPEGAVVRAYSKSAMPTTLVDYGRNKDHVRMIFLGVSQRLGPGSAVPGRAPMTQAQQSGYGPQGGQSQNPVHGAASAGPQGQGRQPATDPYGYGPDSPWGSPSR